MNQANYSKEFTFNSRLDAYTLGSFNCLSFAKFIYPEIQRDSWESMKRMSQLSEDEVLADSMKIFYKYNERQRKKYIQQLATDLHETHHFHQYALLPAGKVLFDLFLSIVIENVVHLQSIYRSFRTKKEPFKEIMGIGLAPNEKVIINYYTGNNLPPGEVQEILFDVPFIFSYKFPGITQPGFMPVIEMQSAIRPLGWIPIVESWTQSLIEALVYRQFPREYYEWFQSTTHSGDLWVYTMIDWVFSRIFQEAYEALDPLEKHNIIAAISIASCVVGTKATSDFFQRRENQPGWQFAFFVNLIWKNKEYLIKNGKINTERLTRFISRIQNDNRKIGFASIPDHFIEASIELKEGPYDSNNLILAIYKEFYEIKCELLKTYLTNPYIFLNAAEWLTYNRFGALPQIPLAIAKKPEGMSYHIAFPMSYQKNDRKRDQSMWFSWFLLTQVILNLADGKITCPLREKKIYADCTHDESCEISLKLLTKDPSCHLYRFLVGSEKVT